MLAKEFLFLVCSGGPTSITEYCSKATYSAYQPKCSSDWSLIFRCLLCFSRHLPA